jgi:Fe-Mn family superoxide dismutase
MKRREFLSVSIKAGALLFAPAIMVGCQRDQAASTIALPALPYPEDALEPYISARTIKYHYGKHHKGYVNKTKLLIKGTPFVRTSLEELVRRSHAKIDHTAIYNNAAQVFNHNFYWNSMHPGGGELPAGVLMDRIKSSFGSYKSFREAFIDAAIGHFGSGWVWLIRKGEELGIVATSNADTPITQDVAPLLVIDVWEHAYYLDYQNRRKAYVEGFFDHLANWSFAQLNLGS